MRLTLPLLCCAVLLSPACSRSAPTTPPPAPDSSVPTYGFASGAESLVALFEVTVDPVTLETEVAPVRGLASQPPQAISYDLDIENFLEGDTFRVAGVEPLADNGLRVLYTHTHPFDAPVVANPITAQNRADLGYTGRLLILANETSAAFFDGAVALDPAFVRDPDGYLSPGDLLATGPHANDTFPYKLLADEARDNRVGLSNEGVPQGNYAPSFGGWQRTNLGAGGNGWTGYDFVHGGQTVSGQLDLTLTTGAPLTFRVGILIKYTDPRGTGNKNFRLPFEPADTLQFAYRLPFAALDASKIELLNAVDFGDFAGSARTMHVGVRDWDATAAEAVDADLSDEGDVSLIQPGASGEPALSIDMPHIAADPFPASGASGSGLPGDELDYAINATNTLSPGSGDYLACVRVVDPEDALDDSAYHFGVDPETLAPTRTPLAEVTYQIVPYSIGGALPVINGVSPDGLLGLPGATVTFIADQTGATGFFWSFGRGAFPGTSTEESPTVILDEAGVHFGTLIVTNARGASEPFTFEYFISTPNTPAFASHKTGATGILNPVVVMKDDRPALFWTGFGSDATISFGRATVASPSSSADWDLHATPLLSEETTEYGPLLDATVQEDRFVVVSNQQTIAIASVDEPADTGDWDDYAYDDVIDGGYGPTITALPDRLMIAAYHRGAGLGDDEQDARLSWSSVPLPPNAASWTHTVPFEFTPPVDIAPMDLVPFNGTVAWAYTWRTAEQSTILVRRAISTTPLSFGDWPQAGVNHVALVETLPISLEMRVLNERLHLLYQSGRQLHYGRSVTNFLNGPEDWIWHMAESAGPLGRFDFHLRILGDRPVILYGFGAVDGTPQYHLMRPVAGHYTHESDWVTEEFFTLDGLVPWTHVQVGGAEVLNDRLHLAYIDHSDDSLNYAISDGAW